MVYDALTGLTQTVENLRAQNQENRETVQAFNARLEQLESGKRSAAEKVWQVVVILISAGVAAAATHYFG